MTNEIARIAWSPDGRRLFAMSPSRTLRFPRVVREDEAYVIDLASTTVTPLGRLSGFDAGHAEVVWAEPDILFVFPGLYQYMSKGADRLMRLDLTTLAVSRAGDAAAARTKYDELWTTKLDHPLVALTITRSPTAHQELAVRNRDSSFTRVLYSSGIDNSADAWAIARSARYAAMIGRQGSLLFFEMGTTERAPLNVDASITDLAQTPNDAKAAVRLAEWLSTAGADVYADVYSPRINPLNKQTVGFEGMAKGAVRIVSATQDGTVKGRFVFERGGPAAPGDVLRDFRSAGRRLRDLSAVITQMQ